MSSEEHAQWVDIAVSNQGKPIDSVHLARLFGRFYRCDPSRSDPNDSGGLGLAIAQSIMHLHKGRVLVTSTEAQTRFTLRFYKRAMQVPIAQWKERG